MFKRRDRAWVAALLAGALVAGVTTQASATTVAPDRPTGLSAVLGDGGVLLSWDAPHDAMDSWQVLRRIRPAETAHTVIATVDGELNEWTDTDLTAGDRRYKIAAVRDSLTSRRSQVAKLMLDEPPPLRPTPSTITQVPEKELATEKGAGDTCTPAANLVDITPGTAKDLSNGQNWVKVTLTANVNYQIYYDANGTGTVRINFVCGPDDLEITETRANAGTGLGSQDASLVFRASTTGFHYVKTTMSSTFSTETKTVLVSDLRNADLEPAVAVGETATGTILSPTDTGGVFVPMESGTSYQIDVRSVGYPGIDPWIVDIWDVSGPITRTGRCDYTNTPPDPPVCTTFFGASYDGFFDYDSGPGNAARVIYTATKTEEHYIVVGSRGGWYQRLGDWRLTVTEASAPFYDDYAADASTTGTVVVGGSVSGVIDSTPSWYNAGDTGGPDGYSSREPGYMGDHHGYSCHRETGDGIKLDGDTCDRDWFEVMLTVNRTYKLQLESGTNVLIDGVYRNGFLFQKGGGTYTARSTSIHYISVAGTDGCSGLHGCTGSYTLSVTQE
ncbi:hypothetical protein [Candidatus Poriferisodalis sp.]|uniref:hypothetical protein n=1 Tax=Candidatus Poriferisodalis sp. TaxID=3101277 RepID=UPI003B5200E4